MDVAQTSSPQPHTEQSTIGWSINRGGALAWMTVVMLMAFAFGANGLNSEAIWADELYSLTNMGVFDPPYSPEQIVTSITTYSSDHVPLYYLLGSVWAQLVGWTQVAMRMFSVLAGVLMIAWLYRLATEIYCRRTGLVAALLMATSAYVIVFLHDIRMYTMLLMLFAMHAWLYWRIAHQQKVSRLHWIAFFLSALALLYTHVFSLLVFSLLGIYHLLFAPRSEPWLRTLIGWGIAALLFLPYLPTLFSAIALAAENVKVTSAAASIPELIYNFAFLLFNGQNLLIPLFAGIVIYSLWLTRSSVAWRVALVSLMVLLLITLLNEAVGIIPVKRMRYFLILWIPFVMICAFGLTSMPRWHRATFLFVLIWMLAGYQFYRSQQLLDYIGGMQKARLHPPMHKYSDALLGKVRAEDYLLGFSFVDYVNNVYKFGDNVIDYYTDAQLGIDGAFIPWRWQEERLMTDLVRKIDRHPYLLLTYHPNDLKKNHEDVYEYIETRYDLCEVVIDSESLFVQRFVNPLAGCQHEYQPIHYENGIAIVDRFGEHDAANDLVRIVTGWEVASDQQLNQYNISIQLLDSQSEKYWQEDWHLYNRILKWHELEFQPARELIPGFYRLVIILYGRETGEKVAGRDMNSGETGNILPLLTFSVEA